MSTFNVFDCFCGLGGLSIGAKLAGHKIVGGLDVDPHAVATFAKIFPDARAICKDLLIQDPKKILKDEKIAKGDVDVLVGGPPCQPYSVNNHARGTHDVRCNLVDRYLQIVTILRPKWLVIENVPGFASIEGGQFFRELVSALKRKRYEVDSAILDARSFGVPQRRRRLIIIASSKKGGVNEVIKKLTNKTSDITNVRAAIGDLPVSTSTTARYRSKASNNFQRLMRQNAGREISGHISAGLGKINLSRIAHVPPGGNWRDIPTELLPLGMQRAKKSDHTTRYGRLSEDQPAFTLLTKCDPHWGCFVHPSEDRVISVREAARIQSVPDHVEFPESIIASYRLIGNAVPPLLAKGIFESISSL